MAISRRDFLKLSGGATVAAGAASLGLTPEEAAAREMELRTKG
ncbi:MAG: formate dehydrogenase subunit alpha, partial [Nitrospirae bacterium CG01_land_8_20_14_3_00_44_22]